MVAFSLLTEAEDSQEKHGAKNYAQLSDALAVGNHRPAR
jgi:hypothetical protein